MQELTKDHVLKIMEQYDKDPQQLIAILLDIQAASGKNCVEKKWAELFPLFSYGCCERLDHKLSALTGSFPRLRKISCSPYSDLEAMMERLGKDDVICFKPNSCYLSGAKPEMDLLRQELVNACELVQKYGSHLVFNMKTLINLGGEPQRLWQWCDMAEELVQAYFG